jgi:hypothetical protein
MTPVNLKRKIKDKKGLDNETHISTKQNKKSQNARVFKKNVHQTGAKNH